LNNQAGSNNRFVLSGSTIGATWDAFIVHKVRSIGNGNGMILSGSGVYFGSYQKTNQIGFNLVDGSRVGSETFSFNIWHVTHVRYLNGIGTYTSVDSSFGSSNFTPNTITNWDTIQVGSFGNIHQEDADIAELRIFNGTSLSASSIEDIKASLKSKWGIV
jgi:hypothetical protein